MRKDSIDQKAIEKAYLIYSENGHQIVDYDFSHSPTDYARGTVLEPENTSKLKEVYNELLPPNARNAEFNSLARRDEEIETQIENLQQDMKVSRQRGNFQQLQSQMKQMYALIKEKERLDADMAVANLGAAQMDVYHDTMGESDDFAEMQSIGDRISALEEEMKKFMEA